MRIRIAVGQILALVVVATAHAHGSDPLHSPECDAARVVLEQALAIATTFQPMPENERRALLARTAAAAQGGKWEQFKTTQQFDGTEQNKRWLTSARI